MGQGGGVNEPRRAWTNRRIGMLLVACAAGLYAVSVIIVLVRN
jgi:hypothetical protein